MFSHKRNNGSVVNSGDHNIINSTNITNNIKYDNSTLNKVFKVKRSLIIILCFTLTISLVAGFVFLTSLHKIEALSNSDTLNRVSYVQITSPQNLSAVDRKLEIRGEINSNLSERDLWIYIYAVEEKKYYPLPVNRVDIDGQKKTWKISVVVGNQKYAQSGNTWRLGAFMAEKKLSSSLLRYVENGVADLTTSVDLNQEVTVRRRS